MLSLHIECLLFLALGTFENLTLKKTILLYSLACSLPSFALALLFDRQD